MLEVMSVWDKITAHKPLEEFTKSAGESCNKIQQNLEITAPSGSLYDLAPSRWSSDPLDL